MDNNSKTILASRWTGTILENITHIEHVGVDDLLHIDNQKQIAIKNIANFIDKKPCLNMLLWGERGSGKSSLIKMLLHKFDNDGLRAVEFPQEKIITTYRLYSKLRDRANSSFIICFDDISFDENDIFYRKFKSIIEGGLEKQPENIMFVATTNKRHLIKEKALMSNDIYDRDICNEQMSLYARFGLTIGFYPLNTAHYLDIAKFYLRKICNKLPDNWEKKAENFAINRGGKSARVAKQFAIYTNL